MNLYIVSIAITAKHIFGYQEGLDTLAGNSNRDLKLYTVKREKLSKIEFTI